MHNLVAWREHLDWFEHERDAGRVRWIGATHYSPSAFDELERVMRTGRLDAIQVPLNPRETCALSAGSCRWPPSSGSASFVMRPFGEGELLGRPFPPELAAAGLRDWPDALLRWSLGDPRCVRRDPRDLVTRARPSQRRDRHGCASGSGHA